MADFLIAYKLTAGAEGGYSNDPADHGGETWKGISRKNFPSWAGWNIVDQMRSKPGFPKSLWSNPELDRLVLLFYRINFWNVVRGDDIDSQEEANQIYDEAVNAGVGTAIKISQQTLGLPPTGKMDGNTLNKLNNKQ